MKKSFDAEAYQEKRKQNMAKLNKIIEGEIVKPERIRISISITKQDSDDLKRIAARESTTMSRLIHEWIAENK